MRMIQKFFAVFAFFFASFALYSTASAYILLQKLPGIGGGGTEGPGLTDYLSWLFRFMLAAAAFLAVVQIVIAGIQMMIGGASESQISNAKGRIQDAIYGLLLALASWLILYTINPNLAQMKLTIPEVKIEAAALAPANATFVMGGSTSHKGEIGSGTGIPVMRDVTPSLQGLSAQALTLNSQNTYVLIDKSDRTLYVYKNGVPIAYTKIEIGKNDPGSTKVGGEAGNNITPVGEFTIKTDDKRMDSNGVYTRDGANLGAAFLGISATDKNGAYRGIGIHGSVNDSLGSTAGCVRVRNADAVLLYRALQGGTKVTIRN